jgi:hypothetical protein
MGAWDVNGLLPIRGGPEAARGTAGPGRGPAAGRGGVAGLASAGPAWPGGVAAGRTGVTGAALAATAGGALKTPFVAGGSITGAGLATWTASAAGVSTAALGLSAVFAVAPRLGAAAATGSATGSGKDSLSLRTTGASIVEEADRTNSPNS